MRAQRPLSGGGKITLAVTETAVREHADPFFKRDRRLVEIPREMNGERIVARSGVDLGVHRVGNDLPALPSE